MPAITRWLNCREVPSLRIGGKLFYVQAVVKDGRTDISESQVYSPISVSGDRVFARVSHDTEKMAVLAEYFRETYAAQRVNAWRKAR